MKYICFFFLQTSDQRADGPAESRPFAAVQHQATAYSRPDHTASTHAFFAHIAWIWKSRDSRCPHGHTGNTFYIFSL